MIRLFAVIIIGCGGRTNPFNGLTHTARGRPDMMSALEVVMEKRCKGGGCMNFIAYTVNQLQVRTRGRGQKSENVADIIHGSPQRVGIWQTDGRTGSRLSFT